VKKRYPLDWPSGWKRTANRESAKFSRQTHEYREGVKRRIGSRDLSISEATDRVTRELRTMGIYDSIISSNLILTSFGTPRSAQREPDDPGVAVYWDRRGKPQCMAIDQYDRAADNLAAIAASLAALRAIERHGGAQIMERAFIGFAALPESTQKSWRVVLQIAEDKEVTKDYINERFRTMAALSHPDIGGTHDAMAELNAARSQALRECA
jgi:hypothetical protein